MGFRVFRCRAQDLGFKLRPMGAGRFCGHGCAAFRTCSKKSSRPVRESVAKDKPSFHILAPSRYTGPKNNPLPGCLFFVQGLLLGLEDALVIVVARCGKGRLYLPFMLLPAHIDSSSSDRLDLSKA